MPLNLKPYLLGAALILSFLAGFTVEGYRKDNQILDMRLEASQTALDSAIRAKDKTKATQAKISAIDGQKTKELNHAKSEINRMRESVANGSGWLQLNANCPKLPGLTIDPGMGDGTAPRLTDTAEQGYILFRERLSVVLAQLDMCQTYVKEITKAYHSSEPNQ